MRAILQKKKKAFRQSEINSMTVPRYEELSVKHLFDEVMIDADVSPYLPDLD